MDWRTGLGLLLVGAFLLLAGVFALRGVVRFSMGLYGFVRHGEHPLIGCLSIVGVPVLAALFIVSSTIGSEEGLGQTRARMLFALIGGAVLLYVVLIARPWDRGARERAMQIKDNDDRRRDH